MRFDKEEWITWLNRNIKEPVQSYLGYPVIDWGSLIASDDFKGESTFDVDITPNGWGALLTVVRNTLNERSAHSWACELNALENTIAEQRSDAEETNFTEDFKTFTRFMFLSLNQESLAPYVSNEVLSQQGTQKLLQCLITARFQTLPEIRSIDALLQQSHELNALVTLVRPPSHDDLENTPSTSYMTALINTLSCWLKALFVFLKQCLKSDSSATACPYEYAKVANSLWDIGVRFQLNAVIDAPETRQTLVLAYQNTIERMQNDITPNLDTFLNQNIDTYNTYKTGDSDDTEPYFFNLQHILSSLNKAYTADLESLTHWGESHYRQAILIFESASDELKSQGVDSYINAYQTTHKRIELLSSRLYCFRNQIEKILRSNPAEYCDKVDFLNAEMLKIEDKLTALQRSWLKLANTLKSDSMLLQASQCLGLLLTPAIYNLNQIIWAEYTAYCSGLTEMGYAFEIQQRTHIEKYHLETTQTQSDFLLFNDWPRLNRQSRQSLAQMHPDKFQSTPLLLPVARFCTDQVIHLRERADKVKRMWGFSQWYDLARREADELKQEDERFTEAKINNVADKDVLPNALEVKIEVPHPPEAPLTLNILRLNQRYQVWALAEPSLKKRTSAVEAIYTFYKAPFDAHAPMAIFELNLNKQQYPAKSRQMKHLMEEQEKLEMQIKEIQDETRQAIAKREEADEITRNTIEMLLKGIKNTINRSICANEVDDPTLDGVNALRDVLLVELLDIFTGVSQEHLMACIDECISTHPKIQPILLSHNRHSLFSAPGNSVGRSDTAKPSAESASAYLL